MPRPPILPTIDWKSVFHSGQEYRDWIATGESLENRNKVENTLKTLVLEPHVAAYLAALPRSVNIIAIAEDWCGDVVRHVPVLQQLADASASIAVRYISRAHSPEVFTRFLTNGGEAIPKFIFLNDSFVECGNWGPMPNRCREIIARGKACGDLMAARKKVHAYYEADANLRIVTVELLHLLDIASSRMP